MNYYREFHQVRPSLLSALKRGAPTAFDTEFDPTMFGPKDMQSTVAGVKPVICQFALREADGTILNWLVAGEDLIAYARWFQSDAIKVAHNANVDRHVVENLPITTANVFDTMTLARFLFPTLEGFGLKYLHSHFTGQLEGPDFNKVAKGRKASEMWAARDEEFVTYSLKDPVMTLEVWESLCEEEGRRV